jgi:hypothetical protein
MASTNFCTIEATQHHGRSSMNALISCVEWVEVMIFSFNVFAYTVLIEPQNVSFLVESNQI